VQIATTRGNKMVVRVKQMPSYTRKFNGCVKKVRKTRKESSAIAICTKTILFPHGRTIKKYRKSKLTTQKRK
jgi:hypothetical protein